MSIQGLNTLITIIVRSNSTKTIDNKSLIAQKKERAK